MNRDWLGKATIAFSLVVAHIAIPIGGWFALRIGRQRFFGLLMYATSSLIIFDILLISGMNLDITNISGERSENMKLVTDIRIISILFFAAIAAFALLGRGWVSYLLASLTGCNLVFRIKDKASQSHSRILLLAGLILAVLLLSKIFTVAYLIPTVDTVKHAEIAKSIVELGSVSQFQDTGFTGFLVFHILVATVVQLISVSVRTSAGILFAIIFPASLLATYAFLYQRGLDQKLALLAVVLLAFSPPILTWGAKVHYQSLSYVYFTFVLVLLGGKLNKYRAVILGIPLFIAWVSTHHLSILMGSVLLAIFLLFDIRSILRDDSQSTYLSIVLFLVIISKLTVTSSWFVTPIAWITQNSPSAQGVGASGLLVRSYDSIYNLFVAAIPFFVDYLHLSILLALASIGMILLVRSRPKFDGVIIGAAFGSIFYFPNPLWIPLRGLATLQRWAIMVQPFVVVLLSAGMYLITCAIDLRSWLLKSGSVVFVISLLFLMVSAGFFAPTTSDFIGADRHDLQYLTNQDLEAADWVKAYSSSDEQIYATSKLRGYLVFTSGSIHEEDLQVKYRYAKITGVPGQVIFPEGITVFQQNAFQTEAIRVTIIPDSEYYSSSSYYPSDVTASPPVSSAHITYNPHQTNTVYTNGNTVVHQSK
ncbi:MAG: hypothetical protein ABEI86_03890 [Halobacteriaceae archaeon]